MILTDVDLWKCDDCGDVIAETWTPCDDLSADLCESCFDKRENQCPEHKVAD